MFGHRSAGKERSLRILIFGNIFGFQIKIGRLRSASICRLMVWQFAPIGDSRIAYWRFSLKNSRFETLRRRLSNQDSSLRRQWFIALTLIWLILSDLNWDPQLEQIKIVWFTSVPIKASFQSPASLISLSSNYSPFWIFNQGATLHRLLVRNHLHPSTCFKELNMLRLMRRPAVGSKCVTR